MFDVETIKQNNNIVDVAEALGLQVKQGSQGATSAAHCFKHQDNHPSLMLLPEVNRFSCASCGLKGDVISLVQEVQDCSFKEAIAYLGGEVPQEEYRDARDYVNKKGLSEETLAKFGITLTDNSLNIPTQNGIKTRVFGSGQKYTNTKGNKASIFKTTPLSASREVFVTEGEIDAIKLWQETGGMPVWSPTNGSQALSANLAHEFNDARLIYLGFDADKAGRAGARKAAEVLGKDRCRIVQVPFGKDWSEYFMLGGDLGGFHQALKDAVGGGFNPLKATELSHEQIMNLPDRGEVYLVRQLIPKGCTIISAPPKSMKSFLMLHLLECLTNQTDLFDHFPIKEQQKILLLDRENDPYLIKKRLELLKIEDKGLLYYNNFRQSLRKEEYLDATLAYIEELGPGVVVLDSMVRFLDGNENSSEEVSKFFNRFVNPIKDMGINVIIIHHNNKNPEAQGSNKMRGSSDFSAFPDCTIQIKKRKIGIETVLEIKQTDNRHDEELERFGVKIESDHESISFTYLDGMELEDDKRAVARIAIRRYFERFKDLERSCFEGETYRHIFGKTNRDALDDVIKEMIHEGTIRVIKGKYGKHIYNLREEEDDSETEESN